MNYWFVCHFTVLCTHSFPCEKFQTTTAVQCADFSRMDTSFTKTKLHLLYLLQRGGTESCQLHLPLGVFFLTLAESQSCLIFYNSWTKWYHLDITKILSQEESQFCTCSWGLWCYNSLFLLRISSFFALSLSLSLSLFLKYLEWLGVFTWQDELSLQFWDIWAFDGLSYVGCFSLRWTFYSGFEDIKRYSKWSSVV